VDLQQSRRLLGQHWGAFVAAANDPVVRSQPGGMQQYVWQTLSNDYLSRGEAFPPGSFLAVNTLLSLAVQQRRASERLGEGLNAFGRTGIDQSLDAGMIAPGVDSSPLGSQPLGPQYRLSIEGIFEDPLAGDVAINLSYDLGYNLPQSMSGLQDAADAAAQLLAEDSVDLPWSGVAVPVAIQSY
jgi:hypothetical protein